MERFVVVWHNLTMGIESVDGPFDHFSDAVEYRDAHAGGDYSGYVIEVSDPERR